MRLAKSVPLKHAEIPAFTHIFMEVIAGFLADPLKNGPFE